MGSRRSGLTQAPQRAAGGRREDGGKPKMREMAPEKQNRCEKCRDYNLASSFVDWLTVREPG